MDSNILTRNGDLCLCKHNAKATNSIQPINVTSKVLIDSQGSLRTMKRVIAITTSTHSDSIVPLRLSLQREKNIEGENAFVRTGNGALLISVTSNISNQTATRTSLYNFSDSEESRNRVEKNSLSLSDVLSHNVELKKPLTVTIKEKQTKFGSRISQCIEILGSTTEANKRRIERADKKIAEHGIISSERITVGNGYLRLHLDTIIMDFPLIQIIHNRSFNITNIITEIFQHPNSSEKTDNEGLESDEQHVELKLVSQNEKSLFQNVVEALDNSVPLYGIISDTETSKTGTPNLTSSLSYRSSRTSMASVKSRPATPFVKKRNGLSKTSATPNLANISANSSTGSIVLGSSENSRKAIRKNKKNMFILCELRKGNLFGKSRRL